MRATSSASVRTLVRKTHCEVRFGTCRKEVPKYCLRFVYRMDASSKARPSAIGYLSPRRVKIFLKIFGAGLSRSSKPSRFSRLKFVMARSSNCRMEKPNQAAPVNAPVAPRFQLGHPGRRVTEQRRLPVKTKQHRQTLRMSLDGIRNGAMIRRPTRPGRRAPIHAGGEPRGTDSNTFAAGSAVRRQTRRMEPPGERSLSKGLSPRPAAHPQRSPAQ